MITEKELLILSHLRQNSRKSVSQISRETKIPATTVYDIVDRLHRKGIIERDVAIIDFAELGFGFRMSLAVKAKNKEGLLSFLMTNKSVNSLCRVSEGFDYLVDLVFRNIAEYELFKEDISRYGLTRLNEHHIIEEVKKENCLIK